MGWGFLPALLGVWAIVVLLALSWRRRAGAQRLHQRDLLIALVNALVVGALCWFGPTGIASDQELKTRLPIYLGVTGYRLALQPARAAGALEVSARLGPEPLVWPPPPEAGESGAPYHLVVPGLAAEDESGRAPNGPSLLRVACERTPADTRCALTLAAGERRRDYLPAVERDGRWQWVGTQPIASGQSIAIEPAVARGPAHGPRTLTVRHDGDDVWLDGCRVRAPDAGEAILPVADLYFLPREGGCAPRELRPEDSERGLWLRPAADGGTELPAYSFLAVRPGPRVDLVALDDRAFVVTAPGAPDARAEPVRIPLAPGETVRVAVLRRTFRERPIPRACAGSRDLLDCLRLTGELQPLAWTVRVQVAGQQATLALDIDRESPLWRPLAWSAFTPDRLMLDGQPIRFSYEQGRWRSGEPRPRSSHEQPLELPFRLLGGLPYGAQFLPQLKDIDRATLLVRDSARQPHTLVAGDRFELGPPEARAVLEFERARSSTGLARAALAPLVLVALGIFLAQVLLGPWERLRSAALLVGCAVVVVTCGQLFRVHAGYALVVHEPWDHGAFQQIAESSAGLAAALALALPLAVAARALGRWRRLRDLPDTLWPVAVALLLLAVAIARGLLSLGGVETLGRVRLVLVAPILTALVWYLLCRASVEADASRTWRWLCDRPGPGRLCSPIDAENARRWRLVCLAVSALAVAAWFRDLGALLLLLVPIALAVVLLFALPGSTGRRATLALVGGVVALGLLFPGCLARGALALNQIREVPALPVGHQSACGSPAGAGNGCALGQGPEGRTLDLLERAELTGDGRAASRRHALRLLDWLEDGSDASSCFAAERFATNEALEVAFFRAQVRHYRAARDQRYLRDGLLPFGRSVQRAFVADYLGAVAFAPQMPRGSLVVTTVLLLALLAAAALVFPRAWRSPAGAAAFGALGFLACASVLTVAANLDLLPNFAQNLPLLAVRSRTAWMIDALALGLALVLLAAPEEDRA